MAVSREIKPPSKFQDCVTGVDLDILCKDNNENQGDLEIEKPLHCYQVNGRTNNVTFRTLPDRIDLWKTSIMNFFGQEKTTSLKDGTVLKIICDFDTEKNCSIKVNFYKTGSIVIQGAKCGQFSDTFFTKLKNKVHVSLNSKDSNNNLNEDTNESESVLDCTQVEQVKDMTLNDSSITFEKKNTSINNSLRLQSGITKMMFLKKLRKIEWLNTVNSCVPNLTKL